MERENDRYQYVLFMDYRKDKNRSKGTMLILKSRCEAEAMRIVERVLHPIKYGEIYIVKEKMY